MQDVKNISIFILMFLFSTSVLASSAEEDFEKGISSFEANQYLSAVENFESARKKGVKTVALFYNLASSYFKLGDFKNSKKYFKQVAKTRSMKDLAEYNLGLIALKENDKNKAKKYFKAIVSSSSDEKLVFLSKKKLKIANQKRFVDFYLSTNIGYGENISSVSDLSGSSQSDYFYDFYIAADALIFGKKKEGWSIAAAFYNLDYFDSGDYDEYKYSLGLIKEIKLSDWETSVAISSHRNNYADTDYLSSVRLDAKGRKRLSKQGRFYIKLQSEDITSRDSGYDYLEGWRQRIRLEFRNYGKKQIHQIYYELELNDRGILTGVNDSYDYSATRHTLRTKYTHLLNKKWRLNGELYYRLSDFPASDTINRNDKRWKAAVSADYRMTKSLKLTSKLQYLDNTSTADRYNYDKSYIKFGLIKTF